MSIDALTCAGAATLNGNVTLGNSSTDDITFTGSLASSIPIKTDATYDIGSTTLGLRKAYFTANSNSVSLGADASASADWAFTFPPASGTVGHGLQAASSGAHVYAPMQTNINAVSGGNYTITDTDGYRHIHVTTGASDRTITLPTAADNTDRVITIKKVDSGVGKVTIDGESTETIDGQTTDFITYQYGYITVVCDGTGWHVTECCEYGTYTPTGTGVTNIDNITEDTCQFHRVGRRVMVTGKFATIDPTSSGDTIWDWTLPIAPNSTFSDAEDLSGYGGTADGSGLNCRVYADVGQSNGSMRWTLPNTTNRSIWFTASYNLFP